jgi:hypothetical protein
MDLKTGWLLLCPLLGSAQEGHEWAYGRNGLSIHGGFQSRYAQSTLSGPSKVDTLRAEETVAAGTLDLDLLYRPFDPVQAQAMLRFHQDWREAAVGKGSVAEARRLAIRGRVGPGLTVEAGDFRTRWTPLTLWSPEPDLPGEPEIFARERGRRMEERFLGESERNLQGLDAVAMPFPGRLIQPRIDLLAARIRRAEFLDKDGAQGFGLSRSDMDRFLVGSQAGLLVRDAFLLGGSFQRLADDRSSYRTLPLSEEARRAAFGDRPFPGYSLNGMDSVISRNLDVASAHAGYRLGSPARPGFSLDLFAEYAGSAENGRLAWGFRADTAEGRFRNIPSNVPVTGTRGRALSAEATAGWSDSRRALRLTATWLQTGRSFLNPLAQTPAFVPARILNSDNDTGQAGHYNSFDALYQDVYRFSPARKGPGRQPAPYRKSAYQAGTWSPEDLKAFRPDPIVQLELPFGPATPNRTGFIGRIEGNWTGAVAVSLEGAWLREPEEEKRRYYLAGGSFRLNLDSLTAAIPPTRLDAGFALRGSASDTGDKSRIAVRLFLAGARVRVFAKWALAGGIQLAFAGGQSDSGTSMRDIQGHARAEIEYAPTPQAALSLVWGRLTRTATRGEAREAFSQDILETVIRAAF